MASPLATPRFEARAYSRIKELDSAVLNRDFDEVGLVKGDVGAVVHVYGGGKAYEVEFASGTGVTIAVLTVEAADLRLIGSRDILHARTRSRD